MKSTPAETFRIVQHDTRQVFLHPCSLLNGQLKDLIEEDHQDAFLIYYRKVRLYQTFITYVPIT